MGATWKFSFCAYQIPKTRFENISKIVSETLLPDSDFYIADDNELGEIEILNCEIQGSFIFDRWAIRELKKRIWADGFLEFHFGAEIIEGVSVVEFGQNAFNVYDGEKEANINDYVDDFKHYEEC